MVKSCLYLYSLQQMRLDRPGVEQGDHAVVDFLARLGQAQHGGSSLAPGGILAAEDGG